jgi:hypothetical protein
MGHDTILLHLSLAAHCTYGQEGQDVFPAYVRVNLTDADDSTAPERTVEVSEPSCFKMIWII